jgi:hypothetical protein
VNSIWAQGGTLKNSLKIQNNKFPSKEEYYKVAIYKASMENYRLRDKDVVLTFSEGFECVMLSAKSLAERGVTVDIDSYQTDFSYNFVLPIFSLTEDGHLIAIYQKVGK